MLLNGKSLNGYKMHAQDGDAGKILHFFFDEHSWKVRYFAMSSGPWLGRKKVLLTPDTLTAHDWANKRFDTRLSKEEIRNSPEVDIMDVITCQSQDVLDKHYGCTAENRGAVSVHSNNDISGYSLDMEDGRAGHVEDLVVDDNSWKIPYLVVDARSWLPGKTMLIPTAMVAKVEWDQDILRAGGRRERLRQAPDYDPLYPISRDYERQLHDFYGIPGYWETGKMEAGRMETGRMETRENIHELIRKKAQEICNSRGCTPGNEMRDWLEAERIVKSEMRK